MKKLKLCNGIKVNGSKCTNSIKFGKYCRFHLNQCTEIHAGLNPKFKNIDGTQMTIEERKLKYGKNYLN